MLFRSNWAPGLSWAVGEVCVWSACSSVSVCVFGACVCVGMCEHVRVCVSMLVCLYVYIVCVSVCVCESMYNRE